MLEVLHGILFDSSYQTKDKEAERNQNELKPFQKYYVDDYVADKEGRLSTSEGFIDLNIQFIFKVSSQISNISVFKLLRLYNQQQFRALLRYYIHPLNEFKTLTWEDTESFYTAYQDLYGKIEKRNISQTDIDDRINPLSKYLTFNLKEENAVSCFGITLTYNDLNASTLPLAIKHLEYMILAFKTGSYSPSSIHEMNELMVHVLKGCYQESFQIHYIDNLLRQGNISLTMFNLNFILELKNKNRIESQCIPTRILRIRNIDRFKTVLLNYHSDDGLDIGGVVKPILLQLSSKYKDLHEDIIYRNTLQSYVKKILDRLKNRFLSFHAREDENDSSILHINYSYLIKTHILFAIKHLELMIQTFKIGNDNNEDRDIVNELILEVKNNFLPLLTDYLFESFFNYHTNNLLGIRSINIRTPGIIQLKLRIILKSQEYESTKIIHLQESKLFRDLLDSFNFLPNGYLPISDSSYESMKFYQDLLYIFDQDKDNLSILNLHYYSLIDSLNVSVITDHLSLILKIFKGEISNNSTDQNNLDKYLYSIIQETYDLTFTTNKRNLQFTISIPNTSPSLINMLLESDNNIPGDNLDTHLEEMIIGNNLRNSSFDNPELSETFPDKIEDGETGLDITLSKNEVMEESKYGDEDDEDDYNIFLNKVLYSIPYTSKFESLYTSLDGSGSRDVSAMDGRLGGASANFPNLLEVEEKNISMMEDID